LVEAFDETFIIPEGGANEWGREGAMKIATRIPAGYTHICVSVGTGTTFAGLRNGVDEDVQLLGFVPMKKGVYVGEEMVAHINRGNYSLFDKWHFGGFGKWGKELFDFMNDFYAINNIPTDIVYTSKMMYGVRDMVRDEYFNEDARILCIHTGGLQGNASVADQLIY